MNFSDADFQRVAVKIRIEKAVKDKLSLQQRTSIRQTTCTPCTTMATTWPRALQSVRTTAGVFSMLAALLGALSAASAADTNMQCASLLAYQRWACEECSSIETKHPLLASAANSITQTRHVRLHLLWVCLLGVELAATFQTLTVF